MNASSIAGPIPYNKFLGGCKVHTTWVMSEEERAGLAFILVFLSTDGEMDKPRPVMW